MGLFEKDPAARQVQSSGVQVAELKRETSMAARAQAHLFKLGIKV